MQTKFVALFAFGLAVITSGCVRFFGQEGGTTGLVFGLVMGAWAIGSAVATRKAILPGKILGLISVVTVGGWYAYESFVKKGLENAETRQLIVIGISISTLILLLLPSRPESSAEALDD